jgi:hypothetical protein
VKTLILLLVLALPAGSFQVNLAWDDPNTVALQVQGYRLRSNGALLATTTATNLLLLLPNVETYTPVTVSAFNVAGESSPSAPLYLPPPQVAVERSLDLFTWTPLATIDFHNTQVLRIKLGSGQPPVATVEQSYTGGLTWVYVATLPYAPAQFVRLKTPPTP